MMASELLSILLKPWFGPFNVDMLDLYISGQEMRAPSELYLAKVTREFAISTIFSRSLIISLFSWTKEPRCRVLKLELDFSVDLILYSDSTA